MMSMVLEAAQQIQDQDRKVDGYEISNMNILKAMIIPETVHGLETAINVKLHEPVSKDEVAWHEFVIYSKLLGGAWTKNADGLVAIRYKAGDIDIISNAEFKRAFENSKKVCSENMSPRQLYESLESIGMKYGPMFQNILAVSKKDNVSCSTIRIPDTISRMPAKYEYPHLLHPATLDAMFQTVFVAGSEPMVPSFLESMFVSADFPRGSGKELNGHSSALRRGLRDATGSIVMSDESWRKPMIIVKDLHFTALTSSPEEFAESGFLPNHHKLCAELDWNENVDTASVETLSEWMRLLTFKSPDLNILEICHIREPAVESIFNILSDNPSSTPRLARYTLATENSEGSELIQSRLGKSSAYVLWKSLTGAIDLEKQDFKPRTFDLIISSLMNPESLATLQGLLKPKGNLVLLKDTKIHAIDINTYQIDRRISLQSGDTQSTMFSSGFFEGESNNNKALILHNSPPSPPTTLARDVLLITPVNPSARIQTLCSKLTEALLLVGVKATTTVLVHPAERFSQQICIALVEIESPLVFDWTKDEFDAFRSIVSSSAGCLWVTRGGHVEVDSPCMGPAATLLRTIRSEDPQKLLFSLDLDSSTDLNIDATGAAIMHVISKSFDPTSISEETEYAERGGKLLIPRAVLQEQLSGKIERGNTQRHPVKVPFFDKNRPLKLEVGALGNLDSLCFVDDPVPALALSPSEIEIKVVSVGISATDVKTAMGQTSYDYFGSDVSGVVARVGSGTTKLKVGDRVAAIVQGAFKTFVRCQESMAQLIPDEMTYEIAASLPTDLVTAYHAVFIGRLEEGDSVLIHTGPNGLGQAAIQIANKIGAVVYATTRSLKERKHLMLTYQIPEDHILDLNSAAFGKVVRRLTGGRGIDLIISTIGQQHLEETWKCIDDCKSLHLLSYCQESDVFNSGTICRRPKQRRQPDNAKVSPPTPKYHILEHRSFVYVPEQCFSIISLVPSCIRSSPWKLCQGV